MTKVTYLIDDSETTARTSKISATRDDMDGRLPAGAPTAGATAFGGDQRFSFEHSIRLYDRNNQPLTSPVLVTSNAAPRAGGMS